MGWTPPDWTSACSRRCVDDLSVLARDEVAENRFRAAHYALDVYVHYGSPVIFPVVVEAAAGFACDSAYSGVVDEDVQMAESGDDVCYSFFDGGFVGDVDVDCEAFAAEGLNLCYHSGRAFIVDVSDGDVGALFGELEDDAAANALAATGD